MDDKERKSLIKRAAHDIYVNLTNITTIYQLSMESKETGEKIRFADFYGETFEMTEGMTNAEITAKADELDKDVLTMIEKLDDRIDEYIGDGEIITGLHCEKTYFQFGGDDHKRRSMGDNVIYVKSVDKAFDLFKLYYNRLKNNDLDADTEAVEQCFKPDLFNRVKNIT